VSIKQGNMNHSDAHEIHEAPAATDATGVVVSGLIRPALVALLLAGSILFFQVLPQDPVLHEKLTRPFRGGLSQQEEERKQLDQAIAKVRANDPPLGSILPLPQARPDAAGLKGTGKSLPRGASPRAILVLMIDDCSSCALSHLASTAAFARLYPDVAVVTVSPSDANVLEKFRREHQLRMAMVSDPKGRLSQHYNAAFKPRAYLLTATGTLLWCQADADPDLQQVAQILQRKEAR
jgi:peroxiredoxin